MTDSLFFYSKAWNWLLVFILILGCCFRIAFPLADPPAGLSWSGGYYADEGFWIHDARNLVLWGQYGSDEWHNRWVSLPVHFLLLGILQLMPPGLLALRLWAAICSILTLILLLKISKILKTGGFITLLTATSSLLIAYQRIAILETTSIVLNVIIALFWFYHRRSMSFIGHFVMGCLISIGYLTKGTQIHIGIAIVIMVIFERISIRNRISKLVYILCGMLFILIPWFVFVFYPHHELIIKYNQYYAAQQGNGLTALMKNLLLQPFFIYFNRIVWPFLVSWMVIFEFFRSVEHRKNTPDLVRFSIVWLLCGLIFFAPMGYRPLRYYIPLVIPMIIISGWWTFVMFRSEEGQFRKNSLPAFYIWMSLPLASSLIILVDKFVFSNRGLGFGEFPGFSIGGAVATVSTCFYLMLSRDRSNLRKLMPIVLFCLIALDLFRLSDWTVHRTYKVINASRDLANILPENSVIGGQWAPQLCLETKFRAVPIWKNFVNDQDPKKNQKITHLLSWEYPLGNELFLQKQWFPEMMEEAEHIKTYTIKNTPVSLWSVK